MLVKIYSDNPNRQDINRVADFLASGGVAVLPTDTLYTFAASMDSKKAVETIAQLKGFSIKKARYSMLFDSLSRLSEYVRPMGRDTFRLLKDCLPGPYTFIMDANNNVPRNYLNPNRTIGVRVPDNAVLRAVVEALGAPLIGTSVRTLDNDLEPEYVTDPELINEQFGRHAGIVVDNGIGGDEPSTVVDCSEGKLQLVRQGKGLLPFDIEDAE